MTSRASAPSPLRNLSASIIRSTASNLRNLLVSGNWHSSTSAMHLFAFCSSSKSAADSISEPLSIEVAKAAHVQHRPYRRTACLCFYSPTPFAPTNYRCFQGLSLFNRIPCTVAPLTIKRQQVRSTLVFTQQLQRYTGRRRLLAELCKAVVAGRHLRNRFFVGKTVI